MKKLFILAIVFAFQCAFAGPGRGGGGMDSGGGTGLHLRLQKAKELAKQVLLTVAAEDLSESDAEIREFFQKHRAEMIHETESAEFAIKPAYEVFLLINKRKVFKTMTTPLTRGALITVSENVRSDDLTDLAANLIHEVGHHFGVGQSEDAFLDAMSSLLVETALKLNPSLNTGAKACLSGEEVRTLAAGTWEGTNTFIPSIPSYPVRLIIEKDGHYRGGNLCSPSEKCPALFYFGMDEDHPAKTIQFTNSCGDGSGQINLVFNVGTQRLLEMKFVVLSADATSLEFQVSLPPSPIPMKFKLHRK